MHSYASCKSSSTQASLFSRVPRSKHLATHIVEHQLQPRYCFFAFTSRTEIKYSGSRRTAVCVTRQQTASPMTLALDAHRSTSLGMCASYDIIVPGYFPNFPIKFVSGRPKLSVVAPIMGTRAMTGSLDDRKFHLSVLHYRRQDLGTVHRESKRSTAWRIV